MSAPHRSPMFLENAIVEGDVTPAAPPTCEPRTIDGEDLSRLRGRIAAGISSISRLMGSFVEQRPISLDMLLVGYTALVQALEQLDVPFTGRDPGKLAAELRGLVQAAQGVCDCPRCIAKRERLS